MTESQQEEQSRNRSQMAVRTPFGSLNVSGDIIVLIIIIILTSGGLAYLIHQEFGVRQAEHTALLENNKAIVRGMAAIEKEARIQSWLLSQDPKERPQLRTPWEIWERLPLNEQRKLERSLELKGQ